MASVSLARRELMLPLTLSLSDYEPKVFVRCRASAARPIQTFLFSDSLIFLFSDIAAPATTGHRAHQGIKNFGFEIGERESQRGESAGGGCLRIIARSTLRHITAKLPSHMRCFLFGSTDDQNRLYRGPYQPLGDTAKPRVLKSTAAMRSDHN